MITISVSQLEERTINSIIDDNIRFTITHEDKEEEERIDVIADKIALLRDQCRGNKQ